MIPNRPPDNVPRRALNAAVIVGGIIGIFLQSRFQWNALTTFLVTIGLCVLCAAVVALVLGRRG